VNPPLLTAIGAVIIALVTGAFGLLNSTKANRPAEMNAQLAWVKQAQDEATEARQEARDAKAESTAARQESEATRQQQVTLRRELEAMQDWIDRVVRARDAYLADHAIETLEDSGMIRLMRAINGGPHLEPR
jgi:uncharacterized protein (DUF3084 family)